MNTKDLVVGFVPSVDVLQRGAVTLIHGGAGPTSQNMERSQGALGTGETLVSDISGVLSSGRLLLAPSDYCANVKFHGGQTKAEQLVWMAVQRLEASPFFNAGYGGALQRDGQCRVTAAAMESARCRLSAVVNVTGIKHPSYLACQLQHAPHSVLDSQGAQIMLRRLGIEHEDPTSPYQFEVWATKRRAEILEATVASGETGTVGAVSCDAEGQLAALTSTGGVGFESVGRIGDVPTVAGTYCTKHTAVSCTGYGEQIVTHALAARLAVRLEDAFAHHVSERDERLVCEQIFERTLVEAAALGLQFAFICVHRTASHGIVWARGMTTERCAWGYSLGRDSAFFN